VFRTLRRPDKPVLNAASGALPEIRCTSLCPARHPARGRPALNCCAAQNRKTAFWGVTLELTLLQETVLYFVWPFFG
jgi:hypothetical protein